MLLHCLKRKTKEKVKTQGGLQRQVIEEQCFYQNVQWKSNFIKKTKGKWLNKQFGNQISFEQGAIISWYFILEI